MTQITLGGEAINTVGSIPAVGTPAPAFELVDKDLNVVTSEDFAGKKVVLNIFPSVDTGVCAMSVRQFNQLADELPDTTVICVSKDLPFALARFCGTEAIDNAIATSAFRSSFGDDYELTIADSPMRGLLSRAVVIIDRDGNVAYAQQVPEIKTEPDYEAAKEAVEALG